MRYFSNNAGKTYGYDPATQTKLIAAATSAGWHDVSESWPPAPPPPTLAQQAAKLIAGGLTVTSTGTPALDAVYACDANTVSHVHTELLSVLASGAFAGGEASVVWVDKGGAQHVFATVAAWKPFALAVLAFVSACRKVKLGITTTLPSNSATIP